MRSKTDFPRLSCKAVLSPMAGVTDVAFRLLAKQCGAALTYTEFVSGTAIVRGNFHSHRLLQTDPQEHPVGVQLFGNNFDDVVQAAQLVEPHFDLIDINCGCPAWKVIRTGAGSELLKKPDGIATLVNKLVSAVSKPVTVKIRLGIDHQHVNTIEVAKAIEDAGAAAITVHGRTQQQGYSGTADWDMIKQVKEAVSIPVIGNGDVFSPEVFKQRLEQSNVDAIMIARGAMGNPYIFTQISDYLRTGVYAKKQPLDQFAEYLALAEQHTVSYSLVKNHFIGFTKGLPGGARLREHIVRLSNLEELKLFFEDYTLSAPSISH